MLGTWPRAGIYDESLYPITIVDTDDIQSRVIVARRTGSSVISASTLTIGILSPMRYRNKSHRRSCEYRTYVTAMYDHANCHRDSFRFVSLSTHRKNINREFTFLSEAFLPSLSTLFFLSLFLFVFLVLLRNV